MTPYYSWISTSIMDLYAQTTSDNSAAFNFNGNTDSYAWSFVASFSWIPDQLTLEVSSITGTPVCEFYIKSDKFYFSTTYATASWVTLSSGSNVITMTWGTPIIAGDPYWIYMSRTSNTSNVPSIAYDSTKTNYPVYRATWIWVDPDTLWFTNDIRMTVSWLASFNPRILFI